MSGIIRVPKNPFVFGISAGVLVIAFNLLVASLAEGAFSKGIEIFLSNGIFAYLVPLSVAIQMTFFKYHRNLIREKMLCCSDKLGISGSMTSSVSMLLCCLHHLTDLLPAVGFILATSTFLIQYKDFIISLGLFANAIGTIMIIRAIRKDQLSLARSLQVVAQ